MDLLSAIAISAASPGRDLYGARVMHGRWKQLQRALAAGFLLAATQTVDLLPGRRLDDGERHFAAGNHRLERAGCPPVLEAG